MDQQVRTSAFASEQVARLAVAQFLLLEATVESLSVLGERLSRRAPQNGAGNTREALLEPFRARYALMREVMRQPTRH